MESNIKLVALDLDGTLFNSQSVISKRNIDTIRKATDAGINVIISSGRPYNGLPHDPAKAAGMQYAITANGAAVYELGTKKCLYESCINDEVVIPITDYLLTKKVHVDVFIDGHGYSPIKCLEDAKYLCVPPSLKEYIMNTRTRVPSITDMIKENGTHVQKITLNFDVDENGKFYCRDEVFDYLTSIPQIDVVSGGYGNLEFTKKGVSKGVALVKLAEILGINIASTMAIGDSENDLAIIEAAGIGVAMKNATDLIKDTADYITDSNDEDGVATAIAKFCLIAPPITQG